MGLLIVPTRENLDKRERQTDSTHGVQKVTLNYRGLLGLIKKWLKDMFCKLFLHSMHLFALENKKQIY